MTEGIYHIIASYDISDEKRLQRVAKLMKNYGVRVLKSVFECNLSMGYYLAMKHRAEQIINPLEDSIRFYFLCGKCSRSVTKLGKGKKFVEDKDNIII